MRKLPIFSIARHAYLFLFYEIRTIFRLSWFPLLITAIALALLQKTIPPPQNSLIGYVVGNWLLAFIAFAPVAIVAVALHRVILFGDRSPGLYIYFAFGKTECLFWPALFVEFVMLWGGTIVIAMISGLLLTKVFHVDWAWLKDNSLIVILLCLPPMVYFIARLSTIFPIIVVERRVNLREAWELTRGNAWRIFSVWLLAVGAVEVVDFALERLGLRVNLIASLELPPLAMTGAFVFYFLIKLAEGALTVASLSYSYKVLSGYAPDDVVTPHF